MNNNVKVIVGAVNKWLTTGALEQDLIHKEFIFSSPFWKHAERQEFLDQFLDPSDYKEAALSKILRFDPIIHCVSEDQHYFTITLTYHTRNGHSVDEVVLGEIRNGLLYKMTSIYDLDKTKQALELI